MSTRCGPAVKRILQVKRKCYAERGRKGRRKPGNSFVGVSPARARGGSWHEGATRDTKEGLLMSTGRLGDGLWTDCVTQLLVGQGLDTFWTCPIAPAGGSLAEVASLASLASREAAATRPGRLGRARSLVSGRAKGRNSEMREFGRLQPPWQLGWGA